MSRLKVGLFNDSFPPTLDGVAQAVKNYADVLHRKYCDVTVVTPEYKDVVDNYPYEVFRYRSIPLDKRIGYRAGNPFSIETLIRLRQKQFDLMHVHAPFASSVLAQNIKRFTKTPVVLTYHTKFEIDIEKRVPISGFRRIVLRFILENVNNADEVWVVSEGCGQALRKIGYRGGYLVMENGTDFAYGKAPKDKTDRLKDKYGIKDDEFVFLFVGRMMWYKNVGLILDSLKIAKDNGVPFRAFMVGDGLTPPKSANTPASLGCPEQVSVHRRNLRPGTAPRILQPCGHLPVPFHLRHVRHSGQGSRRLRMPRPANPRQLRRGRSGARDYRLPCR